MGEQYYNGAFPERRGILNQHKRNRFLFISHDECEDLFNNPEKYMSKPINFSCDVSSIKSLVVEATISTNDCIGNYVEVGIVDLALDENTIVTEPTAFHSEFCCIHYDEYDRIIRYEDEIIETYNIYGEYAWIYGIYEGINDGVPLIRVLYAEIRT